MTEEEQAECGSVIIGKLASAVWFEGSFAKSSDLWQQGWFYINEPRGSRWAAMPTFRPGPPIQLASWINKGLDWGSVNEVQTLQSRIRSLTEKDVDLVNVVQVMLVRGPCRVSGGLSVCGSLIQKGGGLFSTSSAPRTKECGNYISGNESNGLTPPKTSGLTAIIRTLR